MFELLENIPAWKPNEAITKEAYNEAVTIFRKHLNRAFELFEAYWKGGDALLFDMSLDELLKAGKLMDRIIVGTSDEVTDKLSKRATFMYDLAGCMMGGTNALH